MKRVIAIFLAAVMCLGLCACDEEIEFKTQKIKNVSLEMPTYWEEDEGQTGCLVYYAERTGSGVFDYTTVGLEIKVKEEDDADYEVTFDGLYADNDNMIKSIESAYNGCTVIDYEIVESDHGVKGILYEFKFDLITGLFSTEASKGFCFCFASEMDRRWCYITMTMVNDADKYEYENDYMEMIESIKCDSKEDNDASQENDADETTPPGDTHSEFPIDYYDAASFEKSLNSGAKVNNKTVQFYVNDYRPDSVLGINTWAGEHLNFISEEKLDVKKGDYVIGRITEEPTKSFFGESWVIPYEVLEIRATPAESSDNSEEVITDDENTLTETMPLETTPPETTPPETTPPETTPPETTPPETTAPETTAPETTAPETTAPSVPAPVFYSSNDYETAKKGNTGVFSYRSRGRFYDIYWIIDFDEGYVYYFTDGEGESFCDRLRIDSGTLNDAVKITYHDGGDTWSNWLHFKYVNHPETLIVVDHNGFDWDYSTTDLDDALAIKATKNIKDY